MPPGKEAAVVFVDGTPTEPTEEDVDLYRHRPETATRAYASRVHLSYPAAWNIMTRAFYDAKKKGAE